MPLIDVPGDVTVDFACAQMHDPRHAPPVSGLEQVAQLCVTACASEARTVHHCRHAVAGRVHLARIGQVTAHDFDGQSPDPRRTRPPPHAGTDLRAARAVQHFGDSPADESPSA